MTFISYRFIIFALLVVLIYYVCPQKVRWTILLGASILFYMVAGVEYCPFILTASIVTYGSARAINRQNGIIENLSTEEKTVIEKYKRGKKTILVLAIIVVLSMLAYTKFASDIIDVAQALLRGRTIDVRIIVPLGISYYTFSSIGYMLDVYWKRYEAEKNFLKYLLFLVYFPHILQGPIPRYNKLAPQLVEGRKFEYKRACFGLQLMCWGYFKKLVIADRLAIFVNEVYKEWEKEYGFVLIIATLFYAVQLYTDFSGCMDIAKGFSQILGIELEDNFRQPYFAQTVEEYWRRWHITLGKWFKDYLCMPVTVSQHVKKRAAKIRKKRGSQAGKNYILIISSIAVWIATGLWHGTGMNYIIWGVWNGTIIVSSALLKNQYKKAKVKLHIDDKSKGWYVFRVVRTFVLAGFIPRVLTRAGSVADAIGIFKNMFAEFNIWVLFDGSLYNYGLDNKDLWLGIYCIVLLFVVSLWKERGVQIRETIASKSIVVRWIVYYAAFFSVIIFGIYGTGYDASSFIYMKF